MSERTPIAIERDSAWAPFLRVNSNNLQAHGWFDCEKSNCYVFLPDAILALIIYQALYNAKGASQRHAYLRT